MGSPKINGPAEIKVPATMLKATASSKLKPSFMAKGAAAKAVAPEITSP